MAEWYDEYPDEREDLYDVMYRNLHNGLNADGSEVIRKNLSIPTIKSKWRHTNGIKYKVIAIANELNTEKYPTTVVYEGKNGKVWSRPLSDWYRSFTEIKK